MKLGIDIGHNCPPDTGAEKIKKEDHLTKDVGTRLMQKLIAAGHEVVDCTPNPAEIKDRNKSPRELVNLSLRKRAEKANYNKVDIFVSIHFNAYTNASSKPTNKPMGTEIYAISNAARGIAQKVLDEILKLGFKDRKVKNKGFAVLTRTSMPAILVECCFLDSYPDMNLFDAEKMAEAIKIGLVGEAPDSNTSPLPGKLKVFQSAILKPSTEQSSELPPDSLISITSGEYLVLDYRLEERHYWVKWPDNSKGNRYEHFIFEADAEIIPTEN